MTFNEPAVFAFLGHADGIHAPGLRDWPTAIRVADNQLRAHAAATAAIRALVDNAKVGLAFDVNQVAPASDTERDRVAADQWSAARDAWFLDPLFGRGYPALGLEAHRAAGHLDGVDLADPPAGDLDYLGLNFYRRDSVRALSDRPFDWEIGALPGSEQTQMDWHVAPDGLRDTLLQLNQTYAPREIIVTENGAAYPDTVDPDGPVRDTARVAYLARHVPRPPTRSLPACRSPASTCGRCSTTTSGASATAGGSAWSTSTSTPSAARPRTARAGTSGSSPGGRRLAGVRT